MYYYVVKHSAAVSLYYVISRREISRRDGKEKANCDSAYDQYKILDR